MRQNIQAEGYKESHRKAMNWGLGICLSIFLGGTAILYYTGFWDVDSNNKRNEVAKTLDSTLIQSDSAAVVDTTQYSPEVDSMYVK